MFDSLEVEEAQYIEKLITISKSLRVSIAEKLLEAGLL